MPHHSRTAPLVRRIQRLVRILLYHILGTVLGILPFLGVYVIFVYVLGVDFQSGHKGFKALMVFIISVGLLWWWIHRLIHNPTFMKFSQWLEK